MTIDKEFQALIPALSAEELQGLEESILAEGCRDALIVWGDILIDGHNRYVICTRHGIDYRTVEMDFASREQAMDWMDKNQLGRRNLTLDQRRVIIGRRYLREKKSVGGREDRDFSGGKDCHPKTAEKIAEQSGITEKSVRNYAKDAEMYEELKATRPELAAQIWNGQKSLSDVKKEERREEVQARIVELQEKEILPSTGFYDVIVIDPPWHMEKIERDVAPNQVGFDYPTMTIDEIKDFKLPAADNCHLFMWITQKHLPMGFDILDAWNAKYILTFVWHKNGGFQPFNLPQYNCEFVLYARIGTPQFIDFKAFFTCFNADRTGHSKKPDFFYETIKRVTAGKRIDIFNRREIDGYDRWGNEA